jgi:hypothetical protein
VVLERVYNDITKIKLVKTILGTTIIHESPFTHIFHLDTGEIEVIGENGETFSLSPPETIKGLTLEAQLWQDTEQDLIAFRYAYKASDTSIKADIRIGFYFNIFENKVKVKIEGSLTQAITLKIPLKAANHFVNGNCFWNGEFNEEAGVLHGVGFDWSDIKNAIGNACRWDAANKILEVDIPKTFSLDPNTVTTAAGANTYLTWQKKVLRTSDGTIHVCIVRTGAATHYYSYNDGQSWSSQDIVSQTQHPSVDKDSNDNLVCVYGDNSTPKFKKATVTKGTSWTWSWGSEKVVDAGQTIKNPDIVVDGNNYYHMAVRRASSEPIWYRCTDESGDSWTSTVLSGMGTGNEVSIMKDSSNNLFIVAGNPTTLSDGKGAKINYNGGTSWTVGTVYTVSHATCYTVNVHVLPNNKIIITYCISGLDLYFRKSANASDVSTWDAATLVQSAINHQYFHSIMVVSNAQIRVYYLRGTSPNRSLYYRESTDSGSTWGSEQTVYSTGDNSYPNVSRTTVNGKIDYVWTNNAPAVYHNYCTAQMLKEVADSLCLGDVILRGKTLAISDSFCVSDAILRCGFFQISDLTSFSEVVEVTVGGIVKYVMDAAGLAEQAEVDRVFVVSDVLSMFDEVFGDKPLVAVADLLELSDGACVAKFLVVSDQVAFVEVVEKVVGGGVRTRVFLVLGDLAVQLCG